MTGEQMAVVALVVAGLAGVWVWRAGARTGRRAERATRTVTRMGGNTGRAVLAALVITGVQWGVVSWSDDPVVVGVVLGGPALFAGTAVVRLFAVDQPVGERRRRGGARR